MEGAALTLLHVLNNQSLLPVFRVYCISEGVDEYLNFWFEARMYTNKYLYEESSPAEQTDCRSLFKKYFLPDSTHNIKLDAKIGNELQDAIYKPKATMKVFKASQRFVFDVLDLKLKGFASSDAYKNFLKRESSLYQKQAEKSFDIKEIEVHFKRILDAQKHLQIICTETTNKLQASSAAINNLHALSERFSEYSESINQPDCPEELENLSIVLKKVAGIMKTLESLERQMNNAISQRFEPLSATLEEDIPNALNLKKKVDKLSSGDPGLLDSLNSLRNTNNRIDHRTFHALCEIMEQYMAYFEKGYTLLQNILPSLEKLRQVQSTVPQISPR